MATFRDFHFILFIIIPLSSSNTSILCLPFYPACHTSPLCYSPKDSHPYSHPCRNSLCSHILGHDNHFPWHVSLEPYPDLKQELIYKINMFFRFPQRYFTNIWRFIWIDILGPPYILSNKMMWNQEAPFTRIFLIWHFLFFLFILLTTVLKGTLGVSLSSFTTNRSDVAISALFVLL